MMRAFSSGLIAGALLVVAGCGVGTRYVYVSDIPSKASSSHGRRISGFSVSDLRKDKSLMVRFSGVLDENAAFIVHPALIRNRYVIGEDFAQCVEQRLKASIKCGPSSAGGDDGRIFVEIRSISMNTSPSSNGSGELNVTMTYDVFQGAGSNRHPNTITTRVAAGKGDAEADKWIARALAAAIDDLIAQIKVYVEPK